MCITTTACIHIVVVPISCCCSVRASVFWSHVGREWRRCWLLYHASRASLPQAVCLFTSHLFSSSFTSSSISTRIIDFFPILTRIHTHPAQTRDFLLLKWQWNSIIVLLFANILFDLRHDWTCSFTLWSKWSSWATHRTMTSTGNPISNWELWEDVKYSWDTFILGANPFPDRVTDTIFPLISIVTRDTVYDSNRQEFLANKSATDRQNVPEKKKSRFVRLCLPSHRIPNLVAHTYTHKTLGNKMVRRSFFGVQSSTLVKKRMLPLHLVNPAFYHTLVWKAIFGSLLLHMKWHTWSVRFFWCQDHSAIPPSTASCSPIPILNRLSVILSQQWLYFVC